MKGWLRYESAIGRGEEFTPTSVGRHSEWSPEDRDETKNPLQTIEGIPRLPIFGMTGTV